MNRLDLLKRIDRLEALARGPKWKRALAAPLRYTYALFFREIIYRMTGKAMELSTRTFFGQEMDLLLPSGTDIFLLGGKSHDSEVRLARFLIRRLEPGEVFIDVGAHYGYFSLLASERVGEEGRVVAFEPSPESFRILEKNASPRQGLEVYQKAVSDTDSEQPFFEFPNLYAENNSLLIKDFETEQWFDENLPRAIQVKTVRLDTFFDQLERMPKVIKVDVEGAEDKVIRGAKRSLQGNAPLVVLEYLSDPAKNRAHRAAEVLLNQMGYRAFLIRKTGELAPTDDILRDMVQRGLGSDNVVFVKG